MKNQAYNYGGTYLFMSYLAQRQGKAFIRQLVAQARNGPTTLRDSPLGPALLCITPR